MSFCPLKLSARVPATTKESHGTIAKEYFPIDLLRLYQPPAHDKKPNDIGRLPFRT